MQNHRVGEHSWYFVEPDTIVLKLVGTVAKDLAREIVQSHVDAYAGRPRIFYLIDAGELEGMSLDARQVVAGKLEELQLVGSVLVRTNLQTKVVLKLMSLAVNLVRGREEENPIVTFETDEEAWSWIEGRRRELDAQTEGGLAPA